MNSAQQRMQPHMAYQPLDAAGMIQQPRHDDELTRQA
jgi:hypothetical protein